MQMSARSAGAFTACFLVGVAMVLVYLVLAFNYPVSSVRYKLLFLSIPSGGFGGLFAFRHSPKQTCGGFFLLVLGCVMASACVSKVLPPPSGVIIDLIPHLIIIAAGFFGRMLVSRKGSNPKRDKQ